MINPDVIYKIDIVSGISSIEIITLIISILSVFISLGAFLNSKKVNNLEIKLKEYTLEEIKKNREANEKANVIAEIQHFYDYKIILRNLGSATAYNVDFELPSEIINAVTRKKVPFEELECGAKLYEDFTVTDSTPEKFYITISWEDENGMPFTNKKYLSLE